MAVCLVVAGQVGMEFATGLKLVPYLKARIEEWESKSKDISILVTGKTGTGKSTLINGLVGREVAKEGDTLDPETTEVTKYSAKEGEITVSVFDSPGLQDGTNNEAKYLAEIKQKCNNVDLIVYCMRMSEERVPTDGPDVRAVKLLDKTLGRHMWKNTVFVLTFANDVMELAELEGGDDPKDQQKYFYKQLQDWKMLICERLHIMVGISKETVDGIAIMPAGHKNEPILPDSASTAGESYWLSRVWLKALGSTKPQAQLALIKLNLHRIYTKENEYKNDEDDIIEGLIHQHRMIFTEKGAEIGELLGVPMATVTGELAGFLTGRESFLDSLVMHLAIKSGIIETEELSELSLKG